MVSDEQSSPWLPVNPPREPEDASPTPEPASTTGPEPDPEPTPEPAPASAAPWVAQDWSSPPPVAPDPAPPVASSGPPSTGQIPRVPHPDDPFTEQPTMSQFAAPSTPVMDTWVPVAPAATTPPAPAPEPDVAPPAPSYEPVAVEPEPVAVEPEPVAPPVAAPPVAAPRSPYLTGELPRATEAPARPSFFQAPAAPEPSDEPTGPAMTPSPQEAWSGPQVQRVEAFEPAPREAANPEAEAFEPELTPARPVVPGTGSIPILAAHDAPAVFDEPVVVDEPAAVDEPSTVDEPAAVDDAPAPVTSASPGVVEAPYAATVPVWEDRVPEPIEIDDDDADVVPPIEPPPAEEILPTVDSEPLTSQNPWAWDANPHPEAATTDPVRDLGASAVSAASLQAAGAPTPPSGVVMPEFDDVPDFGSDEPFVPRFEPPASAAATPASSPVPTPAPTPSVSFQPPAPRAIDPLSQVEVPTSDEPAYMPTLAPGAEDDAEPDAEADAAADDLSVSRGSGPATPLEGWPYRNQEFTPAADAAAADAVEANDLPANEQAGDEASADESFGETVPGIDASFEPAPLPDNAGPGTPYTARPSQTISDNDVLDAPFTPLAPERFDDILAENPFAAAAPLTDDPGARPWASVLGQSQREESASPPDVTPVSAADNALAPSQPAAAFPSAPAAAPTAEPETEVIAPVPAVERRPAPYSPLVSSYPPVDKAEPKPDASADEDGPDAGFAGAPVTEVDAPTEEKGGTRRTRLILIIVAAALVAGVIGVLLYRTYLLPEPITLPTPTVTAEPRVPEGEPIEIDEQASEFLAAMPLQAGADVLMAYESIDPVGDESLPARAAEHIKLSYGSGVGEPVFTVHAYQHYKVEDAQAAYDAYAAGAPDVADVTVDGEVVGQRAFQAASAQGQVAWRNGTAVFVLTGPASDLLHFYERFGV